MRRLPSNARLLLVVAALFLVGSVPAAADEASLLTADGTLHRVRSGLAADLGISGSTVRPYEQVLEWTTLRQDRSRSVGIIPGSNNGNPKHNLELAFDEPSCTLLLLWSERLSVLNLLHLGIYRDGAWTKWDLLPNLGFSHAFNPRMLLSQQKVRYTDEDGKQISRTRSILHLIFWEESGDRAQARYTTIFLDENPGDLGDLKVYDLPSLIGSGGPTTYEDVPAGAYMYPSLHLERTDGAVLASFADLSQKKHYVVRIRFPEDLGKPSDPLNLTWQRRHIPIWGVAGEAPVPRNAPSVALAVGTVIGTGYRPTLHWRDGASVRYTRFNGAEWSSVKSIPLGEDMTYERALGLVIAMATRD